VTGVQTCALPIFPSARPGGSPGIFEATLRSPRSARSASDAASRIDLRLSEIIVRRTTRESMSLIAIELENDGSETLDVSGYGLSDDPGKLSKWALPSGTTIAPRSLLVVEASDLGASTLSSSVVYLSTPSADRVSDVLSLRYAVNVPGEVPIAYGRPPGGLRPCVLLARPTPGVPNVRELESDLVIHEIHYRSLADDP